MASAFDINVLEENSIKNIINNGIEAGFSFDIRFTAYRGTWLSCLEQFDVFLDGIKVPDDEVRFCLNQKEFLPQQLKELAWEYWFISDSATIKVLLQRALHGEHRIQVKYAYRIPYTGYFGSYLVQEGNGGRTVMMQA